MSLLNSGSELLSQPDVLKLALEAHADNNIYHLKNVEANRRGDCKENVERLLKFFRMSCLNLENFSVIYMAKSDEDELDPRLAVDKEALRKEEQSILIRHIITGKYRRRQMLWKLHFFAIDQQRRVFDLSARPDLLGRGFPTYFATMFSIELRKSRENTLDKTKVCVCSALEYLQESSPFADEFLPRFQSIKLEDCLSNG